MSAHLKLSKISTAANDGQWAWIGLYPETRVFYSNILDTSWWGLRFRNNNNRHIFYPLVTHCKGHFGPQNIMLRKYGQQLNTVFLAEW